MPKPNGYVLFEGPSALDGAPIVVIATGINSKSSNRKTGAMVQTYILRQDVSPVEAVRSGADASICGDCPHRSPEGFAGRTCYVNVGQGALVVWKAYKRGAYANGTSPDDGENGLRVIEAFRGRAVRFGTYGDPADAPLWLWEDLQAVASLTTGYTHQWRNIPNDWARVVMASADTSRDARDAQAMGYRTFRVDYSGRAYQDHAQRGARPALREVLCPASEEAGKKLTCETCGACNGTATGRRGSIMIPLHGSNAGAKGRAALDARLIARA